MNEGRPAKYDPPRPMSEPLSDKEIDEIEAWPKPTGDLGRMAENRMLRAIAEIRELRTRCLCKGTFRCIQCLEAMEADGTLKADVDATREDMLLTLELLRLLPVTTPITCHQCAGSSPQPEFCGCGGKQTVGEAIRWYESQLEILSK